MDENLRNNWKDKMKEMKLKYDFEEFFVGFSFKFWFMRSNNSIEGT